MKRRRNKLEVSTFPFLAVLLCAMGSLILLLLVIDRRAKAVARAKAHEVARKQAEVVALVQAERQKKADRHRQQRLALLKTQDQHLVWEMGVLQTKIGSIQNRIGQTQVRQQQLSRQIQAILQQLAHDRATLAQQSGMTRNLTQQKKQNAQELARMTEELAQLNFALTQLTKLRSRDANTYSLVPYHGRRGENRRPIYLECNESTLILHPKRKIIEEPRAALTQVRKEVEHLIALWRKTQRVTSKEQLPYLLFLVRPDGISTYYQTLASLQGLKVDFGYEFIERDWDLNFSEDNQGPGSSAWTTAAGPKKQMAITKPAKAKAGQPKDHSWQGGLGERSRTGGVNDKESPKWKATALGSEGGGQIGVNREPGQFAQGGTGPPSDKFKGVSLLFGPIFGEPKKNGESGVGSGISRGPPGSGNNSKLAKSANESNRGSGAETNSPAGTGTGAKGVNGNLTGVGNSRSGPAAKDDSSQFVNRPLLPNPNGITDVGGANGSGDSQAESSQGKGKQGNDSEKPISGGGRGANGSIVAGPMDGPSKNRSQRPLPLGLLIGNRDWLIPVHCTEQGVFLPTLRLRLPLSAIGKKSTGDTDLVTALRTMIARRQATVRDGEPAYRPILRLLVYPNGLRTYYRAYPLLEKLKVRMVRQDIEQTKK